MVEDKKVELGYGIQVFETCEDRIVEAWYPREYGRNRPQKAATGYFRRQRTTNLSIETCFSRRKNVSIKGDCR